MNEKLFHHSKAAKLDAADRLDWMPPGDVVAALDLAAGQTIADVGAGMYEYIVRRLQATRAYRFGVTAVNSQGWESDIVEIAVQ